MGKQRQGRAPRIVSPERHDRRRVSRQRHQPLQGAGATINRKNHHHQLGTLEEQKC